MSNRRRNKTQRTATVEVKEGEFVRETREGEEVRHLYDSRRKDPWSKVIQM